MSTPSGTPPSSDSGTPPPPYEGQPGQDQHLDDIEVVIENLGGEDGVERLTTSSDSSGSTTEATMNTASETEGANGNPEGVNGEGLGNPRQEGATSPLSAYDQMQRELDEHRAIVRRAERRLADLLREERAADNQRGAAPPPTQRPGNQQGQAPPMHRHGRSVPPARGSSSSAPGQPPNLANGPPGGTDEAGGTDNLTQRGTRVFQELKGKVDDEMDTFESLYNQTGLRPSNKHLFLKSTKESLAKLKKEYVKSYQDLLNKKPTREQKEAWTVHLTEGLEHIEVAMDDLSEKANELGTETEESVSGVSSSSSSHSGPIRWHGPRAPELKMPVFNGEVAEFAHWEQLFDQLVGERPDLKGAAKMSYLVAALEPKVGKLINRLGLTSAGYLAARKLLTKKFGRRDLLVATEIATLNSSPKAPDNKDADWDIPMQDTITYLNRVRDTVEKLVNKENLGDIFLQIILKDKMPLWMFSDYDLKLNEEQGRRLLQGEELTWSERTDHIVAYVEQQLATKMTVRHRNATSGYNQGAKKMIQNEKPEKPVKITTTAAFSTGVTEAGARLCCFCDKEGHKPEVCQKLKALSPQDASKICGTKKVCKRCFKTGHLTAECRSGISCEKCNKTNHHTVLHFNESG